MAPGCTMNPAADPPLQANVGHQKWSSSRRSKNEKTRDSPPLQFVTTTSTVAIDESSKRAIRKHASRYVHRAKPLHSQQSESPAANESSRGTAGGQINRFRLGPKGLKHTPNQPPQVSKNFEIVPVKDEYAGNQSLKDPVSLGGASIHPKRTTRSTENLPKKDGNFEHYGEFSISVRSRGSLRGQYSFKVARQSKGYDRQLLKSLKFSKGSSLFGPSSGSIDPFNAMALPITPREQILIHYYFMDRKQGSAPLIPYCQAWFGMAVQDKAYLHAVFSHYSATHRLQFQEENPAESISHLTTAMHMITERLEDPSECCSNGTIGAVASLLIYESHSGALPNISYHMRGLQEMVMRRGGLEKADFPLDLKRLIGWTDLNTANDLWQKPHFRAVNLPASGQHNSAIKNDQEPNSSDFEFTIRRAFLQSPQDLESQLSNPNIRQPETTVDSVLFELRSFVEELSLIQKSISLANRPQISTSDKIHVLERMVLDLIHAPPPTASPLDHACAVATMIFMRSSLRENICNFRAIEPTRLQSALMELGDLWQWGHDLRDREKLVWTVGFGAVSSAGRAERQWFTNFFQHICQSLDLRRWHEVRAVFQSLLWKSELDAEGLRLWEDMGMDEVGPRTLQE